MADQGHPDADLGDSRKGDPDPVPSEPRIDPSRDAIAPQASAGASRITPRSARARLEPERLAQPGRASQRARHPFVVAGNAIFTIILVIAVAVGIGLAVGKQRFEAPGPLTDDKIVNIPRGGVQDMADLLVREGVIDQKWVFIGGILAMKAREDMKAGEYLFRKQASLRDVVETIAEGKVVEHRITVPEGLTSEQIVARLLENPLLSGSIRQIPPEGALLPETYNVTRGTSREQVIQRMQQAQKRVLQEAWERRNPDLPVKSPEQLLVLASIVEKETGRTEERSRVAGVFVNRLRQRMRLQSDPTIIYGLVGGKGALGRPILKSEIEQSTPYNTYVIEGLPPGPIANPGRASIEAAANPARTRDLYFVADGSGGHVFAETLEQHNRNVSRWREIERQRRENGGASPTPGSAGPGTSQAAPAPVPAARR